VRKSSTRKWKNFWTKLRRKRMDKQLTVIYNNPDPQAGGIPRYAHRILEGLEEEDKDFREIDFSELERGSVVDKILNLVHRRRRFISENKDKLGDINHFLQPELYFPTDGTDILTIHDLFMKTYWEPKSFYEKGKKRIYSRRVERCIEHADVLIAVSEQTKNTLIQEGADEEDIVVVNLGVREKFEIRKDYSSRENKIGYLGDFRPRKRVGRLLEEFDKSDSGYELLIGGTGGSEQEKLKKRYSNTEKIAFQGRVPEEELTDWYNSLKAFIFPTELEGFGLPVLEATACGTPVFVYEDANISEEVKEFCVEINNVQEIEGKLDDFKDAELEEKSEEVKRKFDWDKTVEETISVYNESA
jgi:glycosyltransferase involved in cell wall biosynthesis